VALLFLVAVFPCWGATLTCNSTTVTSFNASLVCGSPASAGASVSDGTDASVYAPGSEIGPASASVQFDVTETWTILGGSGSGFIYIENFPPFVSASLAAYSFSDEDIIFSGPIRLEDGSSGFYWGGGVTFTFGVPFSFDESVTLIANEYSYGGQASVNYDTTAGTYQIPSIANENNTPWQFFQAGSNLTSVTLERSAVPGVLTPEPSLILPCLFVLLILASFRRRLQKTPAL
jgi:hypothetical protein